MTAPDVYIDYVPDICPECMVDKHGNCDGRTWDFENDEYAPCPCAESGHPDDR